VCEVHFTPDARDDLQVLDPAIAQRVLNKIRWLGENCDDILHEPLSGTLRSFYKLRVGDYRVLYKYARKQQRIIIHIIDHRRKIYKFK
jgi:mRNA interferase RelE/StbE